MLTYALSAFAIAAVGGLVLAAHVVRGRFAPWTVSLLHAGFGAIGLALLIAVPVTGPASRGVVTAFVVLLVAALGGFFLAALHLRGTLPSSGVVAVHAGVAVVGFLTLLVQVV